ESRKLSAPHKTVDLPELDAVSHRRLVYLEYMGTAPAIANNRPVGGGEIFWGNKQTVHRRGCSRSGRKMVPRRRFERPTCRLGGGCSIQLSYRSKAKVGAIICTFTPKS